MSERHQRLSRAFDDCAQAYATGRPSYPPEVVSAIVQYANVPAGRRLLEVGAGTGAMTRLLAARGLDVTATDHAPAMLAYVTPIAPAAVADVAALPFCSGRFAAVVAATAFHWFANEPALQELARILVDRGRLVLTWNLPDRTDAFAEAHHQLVAPWAAGVPTVDSMEWRRAIDASGRFRFLEEERASNPTTMTHEAFVARVLSTSFVAAQPQEVRERIAQQARDLLAGRADPFVYPYVTRTYAFEKR